MYPLTTLHVPVRAEKEALVVRALLSEAVGQQKVAGDGKKVIALDLLDRAGLDEGAKSALHALTKTYKDARNPMIITGEEITGLDDANPLMDLWALALTKGILPEQRLGLIVLKPCGNSAGAWRLGTASENGLSGRDKWKGGLLLLGGKHNLDAGLMDDLSDLEFLAVVGPGLPENLADKAHVFLPNPLWTEEDGSYCSLDGADVAYKKKVLDAPEGMKHTCEIFLALGERTKTKPDCSTWDQICEKTKQALGLED
jgi:hypothetical protein